MSGTERADKQNGTAPQAQAAAPDAGPRACPHEEITRLREELDRLKKLEQTRSALSRAIYHDLKAPINTIISCIDVVFEGTVGEINPQQKDFLHKAENGLQRLLSFVERLIDISKIEANIFGGKPDDLLIREVLVPATENFRVQAKDKKLDLILNIEPGLPSIRIDKSGLEHIVQNLLSNAIKYTPEGGVVTVTARREGDRLAVEVRDTGIGIDEKHLPNLFDPFHRIKGAAQTRQEGAGLGLSITKMIADAVGGEIQVESKKGAGSAFCFLYPFADAGATADRSRDNTFSEKRSPL